MAAFEAEIGARAKLKEAEAALGDNSRSVRLADFLEDVEKSERLTRRERLRIVDQALLVLEMNYVHLPLKRAMHAVDPIQRLKLLRFRLLELKESEMTSESQFHRRILEIFASTRDLHTLYLLPAPFKDRVACLPFLIEQFFETDKKRHIVEKFMVSRVATGFFDSIQNPGPEVLGFKPGVEVLYWNGIPIKRAIEINGETQAGSNLEARFARGLDNLTIRPLETSLPPDEKWIALTYRSRDGKVLTLKQEWLLYKAGDEGTAQPASRSTRKKRAAIDIKKTRINQIRRTFFAPRNVRVRTGFKNIFYAEVRRVGGRDFGYIRLFSFDVDDPEEFVDEFARVIKSEGFPQEGLIIDVRGNGGGKIRAGERLLQFFTPQRIRPELFEFINTPLNLEICRLAPKQWNLARWADSIAESVITGATYSSGFPVNSERACNDVGQIYYGPVILITDALSYSATDIFAAGFQDNEIGEVLGTTDNTGAGGANVWWYEDLIRAIGNRRDSPFKPLPKGSDMLIALRRSIRVGAHAGRPLEELGIAPDHRHHMTRRDVLTRNDDLIAMAAKLLMPKSCYSLEVAPLKRQAGARSVTISASSRVGTDNREQKIARLDIYIDDRPYKSIDAVSGGLRARIALPVRLKRKAELKVEAYDSTRKLVAVCRRKI